MPLPNAPAWASGGQRWPMMFVFVLFMPGHMLDWAVEWGWVLLVALIGLYQLLAVAPRAPAVRLYGDRTWMVYGMVLTVLTALGSAWAAYMFAIPLGLRDFVDFPRYLVYAMIGVMIARNIDVVDKELIDKAIRAVVLWNVFSAAMLLLDVPVFKDILMLIYDGAKVQFEGGYFRIGIPFPNPNFAALVFMFCLGYFTFYRPSFLFFLVSFAAVVMTGSRSGLLASMPIMVFGYLLVLGGVVRRGRWQLGLFIVLVHVGLVASYSFLSEAVEGINRLQEMVEAVQSGGIGDVKTASIRQDVVRGLIDNYIVRSPVFGWGPGKTLGIDVSDSMYISWTLLFGIPGAVLAVIFFFGMFTKLVLQRAQLRYLVGALAMATSFALILYTGDFMKNYRMYFVVIYFLHIMLRETMTHGARPAVPRAVSIASN